MTASVPVVLAFLWCVLANLIGMLPSKHKHWPSFYVLVTFGVPILAWVYASDGVVFGMIFTLAGISIFRWPVRYLLRWLRAQTLARADG